MRRVESLFALVRSTVLFAALGLMETSPAFAQARLVTLDELRVELASGDVITVVRSSGETITGRLVDFGVTDVEMRPSRQVRIMIPVEDILSLERPRDPLRNGALIGAGIGAGIVVPFLTWHGPVNARTGSMRRRGAMGLRGELPEHSLLRSVALHLGPGAVMLVFYVVTAPWFMGLGFPALFASLVSIPVILVPWMLGYLAWEGKRRTGRFSIFAAVFYRERLAPRHYVIFGAPVILWGALAFVVSEQFVAPVLIERFLSWLPAWFLNPAEFDHIVAMPPGPLLIFLGSLLVFAGVLAPVVEELYFRGHLLPAVERYGFWAPVITVALFAVYHFESPWENPGRFLVVLPMTFVVWHKRSVAFGVAAHVVLNTLSAFALILAVFSARAS